MNTPRVPEARASDPTASVPTLRSRPTGVAVLDQDLGTLPHLTHLVFGVDPGIDVAPFLDHAIAVHLATGGHCVHVTARPEQAVRAEFQRLGFDPVLHRAAVRVVDAAAGDLGALAGTLGPTDLLVVDETDSRRPLAERVAALIASHPGSLVRASVWPVTPDRADAVVRLRRRDVSGTRVEAFQVARRPGATGPGRIIPFRVDRPGGVRPHVAKILVTGPHNAGKSSFVHALSDQGVSVELLGTTVALDHGQVQREGILIDIFGTPGQERFDPVIQQVAHGAQGIIVVLDTDKPSTFHRAQELARATGAGRVPVVWVANKQDAPGAVPPGMLRERLGLGPDDVLLPCVATDAVQATRILDALLGRVYAPAADDAA